MKKRYNTINSSNRKDEYGSKSQKLLNKYNVKIGDKVKVISSKGNYRGIIMPRYESFNDDFVVIKLKSGYNIGLLEEPERFNPAQTRELRSLELRSRPLGFSAEEQPRPDREAPTSSFPRSWKSAPEDRPLQSRVHCSRRTGVRSLSATIASIA